MAKPLRQGPEHFRDPRLGEKQKETSSAVGTIAGQAQKLLLILAIAVVGGIMAVIFFGVIGSLFDAEEAAQAAVATDVDYGPLPEFCTSLNSPLPIALLITGLLRGIMRLRG